MAHTIVIGGQPDNLTAIVDSSGIVLPWSEHGREITAADAEKTLDLTPSTRYRAKSVCSGEYAPMMRNYGDQVSFSRGISGITHNLGDVAGKVRVTLSTTGVISRTAPLATVAVTNMESSGGGAATFADVDQDPYGTITTFALPTTKTLASAIEVGFDNATTLYTGVALSQTIWVYLHWVGSYIGEDTVLVTIEVKEAATVRYTKTLRLRATSAETFVTSVLVDPTTFSNATLNDMSVKVSLGAGAAALYWKIGSIYWQKHVNTGTSYDSGWVSVEAPANDLHFLSSSVQVSTVIPYLNGSGEVAASTAKITYFQFYWDDSIDTVTTGRLQIFFAATGPTTALLGTPTAWRPEIGLIAEGPAWGSDTLEFSYNVTYSDPSIVRMSKGGNDWTIRREPRRRLNISLNNVSAANYASLYSTVRRAGISRPFCVAVKPASGFSAAVSAAVSIYGKMVSFDSSNVGVTTAAPGDGYWRVSMSFEEVL